MIVCSLVLFVVIGGCAASDESDDNDSDPLETIFGIPQDSDIQEAGEEADQLRDIYQRGEIDDAKFALLRSIEILWRFLDDERIDRFSNLMRRGLAYDYTRLCLVYTHLGDKEKANSFLKMAIEAFPVESRPPEYRELADDELIEKLIEVVVWIDQENDVRWIQELDEEAIEAFRLDPK